MNNIIIYEIACLFLFCVSEIRLWEHPTSLLAAPNSTSFGRTTALLVASAKHQRNARGGSFSGPRPNINAALSSALLRASTKQLHKAGCGPSQGLGVLCRSVELTNHRRLTNPTNSIKGVQYVQVHYRYHTTSVQVWSSEDSDLRDNWLFD